VAGPGHLHGEAGGRTTAADLRSRAHELVFRLRQHGRPQRQVRAFRRLSPLFAVRSSSVVQDDVPSFHTPGSSATRARCCGSPSFTFAGSGVPAPEPFTVVVAVSPDTLIDFLPSFTRKNFKL